MKVLLLVDLQNDFIPGGSLGVKGGDEIIPVINELVKLPFDLIIATKDWHPLNHGSFAATHGKKPGEHIVLGGVDQVLWPVHCVQGSRGAEFVPGWDHSYVDKVFYKGTEWDIDSYSAFFDNGHRKSTGLADFLTDKGVKELYIAGLATDYCVKYSVLDALKLGFKPYIIYDACRAVNLEEGDEQKSLQIMLQAGAQLVSFKDLLNQKNKEL